MRKIIAVMAFAAAFGASTRVLGIDSEIYEDREDVSFSAVDRYEANYD